MYSLEKLGFEDYYYLDNDRIYNKNTNKWLSNKKYTYKLKIKNTNKYKQITMKEIYLKLFNKNFCIDNIKLLDGEIFKSIDLTNGLYEISNYGRIKSKVRNNAILLKPSLTRNKYYRLQIIINKRKINKLVHILVAETWLNKPSTDNWEVHHKDLNRLNNNIDNLEYLSKKDHIKIHKGGKNKCQ